MDYFEGRITVQSVAVQAAAHRYHQPPLQPVLGVHGAIDFGTTGGTASLTGSISAVSFQTDIRPPDRGEHWSPPLAQTTQAHHAYLAAPPPLDAVQVGTDVGLVVVFVGVTACRFCRGDL